MLSITLKSFDRECAATSGGVSKVWIYDRDDWNFTQAAADVDGNLPAYDAIARRVGADAASGALLFPVIFQDKEAEYRYTQSLTGSSVKYDHILEMLLPDIGHFITQWNQKVDAAAACHGIGIIVRLNSHKTLVLGEKYVNDAEIDEWKMKQNGSTGTSGKLREDPNGQTTLLTGDFDRGAYEYSGTLASLTAFESAGS